ncbi:VirB10/TraB/TrbI family type IV secretion system protein [Pantoea endophytica]|uniref:VirB10/TraB/TrbI family type IV secretion system protein n=1 Tax=Pantoea sp. BJ2 TaxID=3141322 RepID=A0AAU7U4R7_9GAMM
MENKTPDEIGRELEERQRLLQEELENEAADYHQSPPEEAEEPVITQPAQAVIAPAPRMKSTAEIEQEIRARQAKALEEENADKDDNPFRPEVTKQKKAASNRAFKALIVVVAVVIVVGVTGLKLFQKYHAAEQVDKPATVKSNEGGLTKRSGMGQDVDPFRAAPPANENQDSNASSASSSAGAAGFGSPPPEVTFSRSLAVVSDTGTTQRGSGVSRAAERQQDEIKTTSAQPASDNNQSGLDAKEAALSAVKYIPYNPDLYIPENTPISCALTRRFVSDVAGKLQCVITDDLYSASKHTKLVEKGTVATLAYQTGTLRHGQGRVFIMVTKLRTQQPPFLDIPMIDSAAAGALGEAGVDGWIDTHFADRFVGAAMLGIIPDVANLAADSAPSKDANTDYTSNSRQAFADMAKEAFANSVNIPPTIYKNQGEIITLVTGRDIDFSAIYKLKFKG